MCDDLVKIVVVLKLGMVNGKMLRDDCKVPLWEQEIVLVSHKLIMLQCKKPIKWLVVVMFIILRSVGLAVFGLASGEELKQLVVLLEILGLIQIIEQLGLVVLGC